VHIFCEPDLKISVPKFNGTDDNGLFYPVFSYWHSWIEYLLVFNGVFILAIVLEPICRFYVHIVCMRTGSG
jgi:hypothetical protein